jgi:hypothetical protein
MIRIKQTGLANVINYLSENRFTDATNYAFKESAEYAEKHAREHCADYTGELKGTIHSVANDDGFELSAGYRKNGIDIGELNEYGGSKYWNIGTVENPEIYVNEFGRTGYHPFLRPAVRAAIKMFPLYFGKKWYKKD